jgi:hypothetical protein
MSIRRSIAVVFLALGLALGSAIGVASATEQAFAKPCPMHDQGSDCDCCKGDCTGAMTGCSVNCAVPFGAAALPDGVRHILIAAKQFVGWNPEAYDPFVTGPPSPIPIV